jgi:hypothetical protein
LTRPSRWREFSFAFRQVLLAILPRLSLREMLRDWGAISAGLAESLRARKSQEEIFVGAEEMLA